MKPITLAIIFVCLCHFAVKAQINEISIRYPIIPFPAHLVPEEGDFFINQKTTLLFKMKVSGRMLWL